eukprot:TRINITY_DN513_c2_g1_i1.p1 TRINITY_DN513_c2_g1~~TRINITY_DN513_c2_g1_i1.p1  ORF type:complete len:380 (+),score=75.53 TRINITY_DN513_c2_g1_i1:42-1181(+)
MVKVVIIGAGPCGLTAAIALKKRNVDVVVLEKMPSWKADASAGTSMGLELNGMRAFWEIDHKIADQLREASTAIKGTKMMNAVNGQIVHQERYHATTDCPRQVRRSILMDILQKRAKELSIDIEYNTNIKAVNLPLLYTTEKVIHADAMLCCDGHFGGAKRLVMSDTLPEYSGYVCWRMVLQTMPELDTKLFLLPEEECIDTAAGVFKPTTDGNVAVDVIAKMDWGKYPADFSRTPEIARKSLLEKVRSWPKNLRSVIAGTDPQQIIERGVFHRPPSKPWGSYTMTSLGDSAHPFLPNLDQNWAQSMLDILTLSRTFEPTRIVESFRNYERIRKPLIQYEQNHGLSLKWRLSSWVHHFTSKEGNEKMKYLAAAECGSKL